MILGALYDLLHHNQPLPDGTGVLDETSSCIPLLKDLQCNIVTPHALHASHYFFLRAKDDDRGHLRYALGFLTRGRLRRSMVRSSLSLPDVLEEAPNNVRPNLAELAGMASLSKDERGFLRDAKVASEYDVRKDFLRYLARRRAGGEAPPDPDQERDRGLLVNVLLTKSGYDKLGETPPDSAAFREGMVARRGILNDAAPSKLAWHEGYFNQTGEVEIHALLVVGFNRTGNHEAKINALRKFLSAYANVVVEEHGAVIKAGGDLDEPARGETAKKGEAYRIEPFGYRDSISQPSFYAADLAAARERGAPQWGPQLPLAAVLCPDPNGRTQLACGSYFVFRKLEQDIKAFYDQSKAIATAKGRNDLDIRAELIGRQLDGTPLTGGPSLNAFDFSDDQTGAVCPFHSHIRKANPRADVRPAYRPEDRQIVRRGIPYGPVIEREPSGAPVFNKDGHLVLKGSEYDSKKHGDIGLLFLCAQSDISKQFEHIQSAWANKAPGADTIIGQPSGSNRIEVRRLENGVLFSQGRDHTYDPVVKLRGGEYFFAPSLSFLMGLLDSTLNA